MFKYLDNNVTKLKSGLEDWLNIAYFSKYFVYIFTVMMSLLFFILFFILFL